MAALEKSTEAQNQVTAVQTQTTIIHGDTIQTVTTTNYEQQVFSSKSDWRVRAIFATYLPPDSPEHPRPSKEHPPNTRRGF